MTKKLFSVGILALVLVFGMLVVGCDIIGSTGGNDGSLEGMWTHRNNNRLNIYIGDIWGDGDDYFNAYLGGESDVTGISILRL